jgi:hypothetical protein
MSLNNFSNINFPNPQINPNVNNLICNNLTVNGTQTIAGNQKITGNLEVVGTTKLDQTLQVIGNTISNSLLLPITNSALTSGVIDFNSTPTVHIFDASNGNTNIFVGSSSGSNSANMTNASISNTGVGASSLSLLTSGTSNIGVGRFSNNSSSGSNNTYVGTISGGNAVITGDHNVGIGYFSLANSTSAKDNTCIGSASGLSLLSGNNNNIMGFGSGANYIGAESNNILIGNTGTTGESAVIKIGTSGLHTTGAIPGALSLGNSSNNTEGVILLNNTSLYTPSLLNYYEESIKFTLNWTGALVITSNAFCIRIGKIVTLFFEAFSGMSGITGAALDGTASDIPARFLPSSKFSSNLVVTDSGKDKVGNIIITPSSTIAVTVLNPSVQPDGSFVNFTPSVINGMPNNYITYLSI